MIFQSIDISKVSISTLTPGIGWHGHPLFASGDGRREDICAGEDRFRRDRLLPEDQPLQPRSDAITGGLLGAERGDAMLQFECQEPQGALRMGLSRGLHGGVWCPTPRVLSSGDRDERWRSSCSEGCNVKTTHRVFCARTSASSRMGADSRERSTSARRLNFAKATIG